MEDEKKDRQRRELRQMLATEMQELSHVDAFQRATQWNQMFHEELAAALTASLNEYLKQAPQQTLTKMREVVAGVNAELKQLGLAIACPTTGHPSWLVVESGSGKEANVCRYRFQHTNEHGRPKRYGASRTIPELALMPLPARIESFARRYRTSDQDHSDPSAPHR